MSPTMSEEEKKSGKPEPTPRPQAARPGQRQQEKLQRQQRRRNRRNQIILILVMLVVLGGIIGTAVYYNNQEYTRINNKNATATAEQASNFANATGTAQVKNEIMQATVAAVATKPAEGVPAISGTPIKTSSGLEYVDIKTGTGAEVAKGSVAYVVYTGWLQLENKIFDSTYKQAEESKSAPQPFQLTVGTGQVIPGWDEGLVGMKEGGTRRLIIPPALAYGAEGRSPVIPPNAILVFDVTVVRVDTAA